PPTSPGVTTARPSTSPPRTRSTNSAPPSWETCPSTGSHTRSSLPLLLPFLLSSPKGICFCSCFCRCRCLSCCHPRRGSAFALAFAFAFLVVIPEGDLLLPLRYLS